MALLDNSIEIKKHNSAISPQLDIENVQSFIDDAINFNLIPAIGYDQYTQIVSAKGPAATDAQKRMIDLLQKAAVGFFVYYWADQGAVEFSNAGIHVGKSNDRLPASDKKILSLKRQNISAGCMSLELAIAFMESNLETFPIYAASDEHKENRSLFINTTKEFQSAGVNIDNDARLYQALRTYQSTVEPLFIEPTLGESITQALRLGVLNNSLDEIHTSLLKMLQKAVAFYTMVEAIPNLAISIDTNGVFQLSESVGGMAANVETKSSASEMKLSMAMNRSLSNAEMHMERIRKFLKANKEAFSYSVPDEVDYNDGSAPNVYSFL